ncbi:MAG: hypothetical protein HKN67_06270 [Saprospiraceae bacterium]|nr:hypothetical protein [Saprospiraceae bacterium]
MELTHHSEYGLIKTIWLKHVTHSFIDQDHISMQWQKLNFIEEPDFETALKEYSQFEDVIRKTGAQIYYFDTDKTLPLDSIYCRDNSIATDWGAIICSMGKEDRMNETRSAEFKFTEQKQKVLGRIIPPGRLEGGDVCWLDKETLAVGHSYRTNIEGINQLRAYLEPKGITVLKVDLPHYKGPGDVFHLMSILSPVDKNLLVIYSPLMPVSFRNNLKDMGYEFIEVPDHEFESMACNVLAIAPRQCIMLKGNPVTQSKLEEAGARVNAFDGNEISFKGGGGPTCLTRPMLRRKC